MINITSIYLIEGIDNSPNKVYIGKTKNPKNRKRAHKTKYGHHIIYSVIDEINSLERKDWEPLESYWIQQFIAWGFEVVNKNKGGGGVEFRTQKTTDLLIPKLNKIVIQYDLGCNFIREWESVLLARTTTLITNIPNCLCKLNKTAGGYIWKYKDDIDFTYNKSVHKSKDKPKFEGFGKKPKDFGSKVSRSLLRFYKEK